MIARGLHSSDAVKSAVHGSAVGCIGVLLGVGIVVDGEAATLQARCTVVCLASGLLGVLVSCAVCRLLLVAGESLSSMLDIPTCSCAFLMHRSHGLWCVSRKQLCVEHGGAIRNTLLQGARAMKTM